MEHYRRHKITWKILYPIDRLFTRVFLHYRPQITPLAPPCLIVSNHCTDFDPLLLAVTIKEQAYFIMSDHLLRNKLFARLMHFFLDPIARTKGSLSSDTALTAVRRLQHGHSVAVFPEGDRTFNGRTGDIIPSTAKLARISGASLVTHRFRGGYFTDPRWSGASLRRGLITGEIVHIYPPEELRSMSVEQIAQAIRSDIHEDAYVTQAQWQIPYKGRHLAEHLERALYLCPRCRHLGTLYSRGDVLACTECGLKAVYTPLGLLEGEDLPFSTITDWDIWQAGQLQDIVDAAQKDHITQDDDVDLMEILDNDEPQSIAHGSLCIFRDRLECAEQVFPFTEISGMAVIGPQSLAITCHQRHFFLESQKICCMRKYLTIFHAVTAPEKILQV